MRKLLSFVVMLSLLLSFAFPVAQAGTVTQKVQAAINKIDYITAGEFVTSLLVGAKVKPDGAFDYWGKAVKMGLIPQEVKKDKPITRAQASYIVWKLINAVPELKNKNIPVSVRRVPPTEAFMRGICFFGGPVSCYDVLNKTNYYGYDLFDFIQGYQLLIMEYKYPDGKTEIKYVWDRYKGINITPQNYANSYQIFLGLLNEFKRKYPDKVVYAPRPWQKGWLFTIDPYRDGGHKHAVKLYQKDKSVEKDGYPLSRADINFVTMQYHIQKMEKFRGDFLDYNIKEHPYFNMYFEDFLVNYPRKYPTDHTRFAYYCKDYYKIPQLYREPMLRLADLGIITPDQSALYIGVYYFNAGKTLTRAEAVQMIARVFDKSKRDVLDEVKVNENLYWDVKNSIGLGNCMFYDMGKKKYIFFGSFDDWTIGVITSSLYSVYRFEEPKVMALAKTLYKVGPAGYYGLGLALQGSSMGSYDLAGFGANLSDSLSLGFKLYDEIDDEKLKVWNNGNEKVLSNFVPLAYRDEFVKDLSTFSISKLKTISNTYEILKQYGNVYVSYRLEPHYRKMITYCLYTTVPQYKLANKKDYPVLVAKPNPKYTQ